MHSKTFRSLVEENTYDDEEELRQEIAEKLRDKGIYYFIAADIIAEAFEEGWIEKDNFSKTIRVKENK